MAVRFGILTISDRSALGIRADTSGPALAERVQNLGWEIICQEILPDDQQAISEKLSSWADSGKLDVILTTGGTGFTSRDVTPEATLSVIERQASGLAEAMRAASLQVTPHAMLSRAVAGIRKQTLIINLPGNPRAALENLEVVIPVIPHAVELLGDEEQAEAGHQYKKQSH
ncbi:MAG: MogA/MoaB family molybdenum cofactor biosynthesis protein [Chloroflexota bacterium]